MENDFDSKFTKCISEVVDSQYIAENISEVDSITYVELIVHLQKSFNIEFTAADFASLRTIQNIKNRSAALIIEREVSQKQN